MSGRCGRRWWAGAGAAMAVVGVLLAPGGAWGQTERAARGPRFVLAGAAGGMRDARAAPVLRRRVSLERSGVTVDQALKQLTARAGLEISYSPRLVAVDRPVTLRARDITVAAALTEILLD